MLPGPQALARERVSLQAADAPTSEMEVLEQHLVTFLIDASAADLASGHTELAVARLQAALEYNCFAAAGFSEAPFFYVSAHIAPHAQGENVCMFAVVGSMHCQGRCDILLGQCW